MNNPFSNVIAYYNKLTAMASAPLACRPVGSANTRAERPIGLQPGDSAVKAEEASQDGPWLAGRLKTSRQ